MASILEKKLDKVGKSFHGMIDIYPKKFKGEFTDESFRIKLDCPKLKRQFELILNKSEVGLLVNYLIEKKPSPKNDKDLLEKFAELEHEQWKHWIHYFVHLNQNELMDKIPIWRNQFDTPYSKLSEKDKEKDRIWARKVLSLVKLSNKERLKEELEFLKEIENIITDAKSIKDLVAKTKMLPLYKKIQERIKKLEKKE